MYVYNHHYYFQNFFIIPTETLYPLTITPHSYPPLALGNFCFTFYIYEFVYSGNLMSGTIV